MHEDAFGIAALVTPGTSSRPPLPDLLAYAEALPEVARR